MTSIISSLKRVWRHCSPGPRFHDDDDPLLDRQIRRYFQREYGRIQPPRDIFPRLLEALRAYQSHRGQHAFQPWTFNTRLRVPTGTGTARLLNNVLAVVMLFMVLGAVNSEVLRGHTGSKTISDVHDSAQVMETVQPTPGSVRLIVPDRYSFDPIELGFRTRQQTH